MQQEINHQNGEIMKLLSAQIGRVTMASNWGPTSGLRCPEVRGLTKSDSVAVPAKSNTVHAYHFFCENVDREVHLVKFERIAVWVGWRKKQWVALIASFLIGEPQKDYLDLALRTKKFKVWYSCTIGYHSCSPGTGSALLDVYYWRTLHFQLLDPFLFYQKIAAAWDPEIVIGVSSKNIGHFPFSVMAGDKEELEPDPKVVQGAQGQQEVVYKMLCMALIVKVNRVMCQMPFQPFPQKSPKVKLLRDIYTQYIATS